MFPAQAGAELIQDLYASGVIVPTIDFTSVAEGSFLPETLQTAWDFSTGSARVSNAAVTIISTPGFWRVDLISTINQSPAANRSQTILISDGVTTKPIWSWETPQGDDESRTITENSFIVFLRSGDILRATTNSVQNVIDIWFRQVASVNGVLVNPLGFTF